MAPNVHPFPPKPEPWKEDLIKGKGGQPKPLFVNAAHALRAAPPWINVLAFDDFAKQTMQLAPPPWELFPNEWQQRPWTTQDDLQTMEWLQQQKINVSLNVTENAVEMVAKERLYHPVIDYLDTLTWDSVPRLDAWMIRYLGAADDEYTRAVSRCFLISAVARIYQPGCKADNLPILEGMQGVGKSTAAETLFEPWFSDELADLGSKDAAMQTAGVWCIEIAELDAMSRGEISRIKSFISRKIDRFRPPYGRRVIAFPRQCVFLGSTNSTGYLKDETGGRRYWPIKCGKLDIAGLREVRDQLWAEANQLYHAGVAWWIVNPKVLELAEVEQADRYQGDAWDHEVAKYLNHLSVTGGCNTVTVHQILTQAINMPTERQGQTDQNRVARILRSVGWERYRERSADGLTWRYRRKSDTNFNSLLHVGANAPDAAPNVNEPCDEIRTKSAAFIAMGMELQAGRWAMN
jgi:predicted P-loop ATPase